MTTTTTTTCPSWCTDHHDTGDGYVSHRRRILEIPGNPGSTVDLGRHDDPDDPSADPGGVEASVWSTDPAEIRLIAAALAHAADLLDPSARHGR